VQHELNTTQRCAGLEMIIAKKRIGQVGVCRMNEDGV
jgi:hypothetical protein